MLLPAKRLEIVVAAVGLPVQPLTLMSKVVGFATLPAVVSSDLLTLGSRTTGLTLLPLIATVQVSGDFPKESHCIISS
jgi:Mg/Co/Ni transporter MgtE